MPASFRGVQTHVRAQWDTVHAITSNVQRVSTILTTDFMAGPFWALGWTQTTPEGRSVRAATAGHGEQRRRLRTDAQPRVRAMACSVAGQRTQRRLATAAAVAGGGLCEGARCDAAPSGWTSSVWTESSYLRRGRGQYKREGSLGVAVLRGRKAHASLDSAFPSQCPHQPTASQTASPITITTAVTATATLKAKETVVAKVALRLWGSASWSTSARNQDTATASPCCIASCSRWQRPHQRDPASRGSCKSSA